MDIKSLMGTASTMAMNSFLGDAIHDWVERIRGKTTSSDDSPATSSGNRSEKIKPLLGLAVLSREDNYKFTRTMDKLSGDEQGHLTEFLLEYYIRPAQVGGLLTKMASFWQYDQFMLESVNRDTSSKQTGSAKINTTEHIEEPNVVTKTTTPTYGANGRVSKTEVKTDSSGSTKKTTTTEKTEEYYTPGGTESVTFLRNLGTYYRDGGIKAAEDYLRINKMPQMDPETLKKVEDFVSSKFTWFTGILEIAFGFTKETLLTTLPEKVKTGHTAFIARTDKNAYAAEKRSRAWFNPVGLLSRLLP